MKTRRQFVMAGTAGALLPVAATAGLADAAAPTLRRLGGMPAQCEFERLSGQAFRLAGGGTVTLERVNTSAIQHRGLEQFTLVMRGSPAQTVPAGLHELHHPDTGAISLHLSPSGNRGGEALYRADLSLML